MGPANPHSLALRTTSSQLRKGLKALENALSRSADTLLRRRNKRRLIIDVDSTEDPVHGKQEGAAFNGYFEQVCYHPLFCFTSKGDLLGAKLRPGNAHSADGVLDLISPLVDRYRSWFKQFWLRGDAAFAGPDLYEFCEKPSDHLLHRRGKEHPQMGQDELPSVCSQSSKASRGMSCLQCASLDSECGILGRERQAIHRLGHQAVYQGWSHGGLSCQAVVRPRCVGFFARPLLSHIIRLSLPNTMWGGKRAIDCGDGGSSSNCLIWCDRQFFLRVLIGNRVIYGHLAIQELFWMESDPEMQFSARWGSS